MADHSSLVPGGMVDEVTGGLIILDLADGSQATITIPKARWHLFAETARPVRPGAWTDDDPAAIMFAEQWYGAKFHPLEMLPGPTHAAFRLTHYYKPGGPRVRVEVPDA